MSGAKDEEDRNHEPTPSRIDKARREGDVAQSKETNAAAQQLAFFVALLISAPLGAAAIAETLQAFHRLPEEIAAAVFHSSAAVALSDPVLRSVAPAFPLILAPMLAVAAALGAQRAVTFAPAKLTPKFSRVSPFANARQKFGPRGLAEFSRSAVKLLAVIGLAGWMFSDQFRQLPALSAFPARALGELLLRETTLFLGLMTAFSVALAAVDLPLAHAAHLRRLRMSVDELKREGKENEGDPHFKMLRREKAKALSVARMMRDVPKASVVIVNPEHYAVALKWSRESRRAPICVAKGVDELAAKIKEIAAASGVPIRSDPVTARAVYATVKVGREIERTHYAAVAAALHFAEAVAKRRTAR